MTFTCLDLCLRFPIAVRNLCRLATYQIHIQPHYILLFPTFSGPNTLHLISSASAVAWARATLQHTDRLPGMPHAITKATWKLFKNLWTLIHRTIRAGPGLQALAGICGWSLRLCGSLEHSRWAGSNCLVFLNYK